MVIVEPARLALTSTPSIGPSSAELIWPLSATAVSAAVGPAGMRRRPRPASTPMFKLRISPSRAIAPLPAQSCVAWRDASAHSTPDHSRFQWPGGALRSPRQFAAVVVHKAIAGLRAVLFDRVGDIAATRLDVELRARA